MRNLHLVHAGTSEPAVDRSPREQTLAPLDTDVRLMLEHVRIIAPLPRSVRARVLARAHAVLATGALRDSRRSSAPHRS